jgi:hypothetical protein
MGRTLLLSGVTALVVAAAATAAAPAAAPLEREAGTTFGPIASAPGRLVYAQTSEDDDGPVAVKELDLRTHRTRQLAGSSLPAFGVGATAGWSVFAVPAGAGATLVAVRAGGTRRLVLTTSPLSPVTSRGDRAAWAEQDGNRERVVVRTMTSGREWVAADLPRCVGGRCFRIDYVTLADDGVAFDRGAIGPQPSFVLRRRFGGPLDTTVVAKDPQPNLVPSYAGAYFSEFERGWRRWDFGSSRPQTAPGPLPPHGQVLAVERAGRLSRVGTSCHPRLVLDSSGRSQVFVPPRVAGTSTEVCALITGVALEPDRLVVGWGLIPKISLDAHSEAGDLGILAVHPFRR